MATLSTESKLYNKLEDMYNNKVEKDISESFFRECVEIASEFNEVELRFVLFKLDILDEDVDTGINSINTTLKALQKLIDILTGKNVKKAFIKAVLETALSRKWVFVE